MIGGMSMFLHSMSFYITLLISSAILVPAVVKTGVFARQRTGLFVTVPAAWRPAVRVAAFLLFIAIITTFLSFILDDVMTASKLTKNIAYGLIFSIIISIAPFINQEI